MVLMVMLDWVGSLLMMIGMFDSRYMYGCTMYWLFMRRSEDQMGRGVSATQRGPNGKT